MDRLGVLRHRRRMKLIKDIRTASEAYQVYDCTNDVLVMRHRIMPNGFLEHEANMHIDRTVLDQVIEALQATR